MNLYEICWRLPGGWKLTGKVEADSHSLAAQKAAQHAGNVLANYLEQAKHLRSGHTPTVHQLRANSNKRYRVKTIAETFSTGEKRVHNVKRVFKTREGADALARSLSGSFPDGRVTAEIVEVSA
jgi:hypothetical protein